MLGQENKKNKPSFSREEFIKYKAVFDSSPEAIVILNKKGTVLDLNDRLYDWLGYSKEEALGKNLMALPYISKKSKVVSIANLAKRFLGQKIEPYNVEFITKRGENRVGKIQGQLIKDEGGKVIGDLVMITDVTSELKVKTKLSVSDEIIKNMAEGVYLIGVDDAIIKYANPKFEEMFGYESGDMMGQPVSIVNAPSDPGPEETVKSIMDIFKKEGEWHGERLNIKKDGTSFWCYVNVSIMEHPEYGRVLVSVHTDIDKQKKAELALEKRDRILEATTNWGGEFLRETDWQSYIDEVLAVIGMATEASRVYIYSAKDGKSGEFLVSREFEWVADEISSQIDNPDLQNLSLVRSGFKRWISLLAQHGIIAGPVKMMPVSEQKLLIAQKIKSLLVVPIFEGDHWWGFLGFDDCRKERNWEVVEIGALKVIVDMLGATIERQRLQKENQERLDKLEAMEPVNEKRYQKLIDQQMEIIRLKKKLGEQSPSVTEIDK